MSAPPRRWLAPAKLNLFLHVTGRRADGYHELQTLYRLLDHGDTLDISVDRSGTLALHLAEGSPVTDIPMDGNLILEAARALRERAGEPALGAAVVLTKRIPPGAGLGGGSSDAGVALAALNRLWGLGLSPERLAAVALPLGADIPVFVRGRSAWAEGVGELLEPVRLPPAWYLVVVPPCRVPTGEVFADRGLTRKSPAVTMADFLAGGTRNDCEPVVRRRWPEVDRALAWLSRYAEARMTGTGGAAYAAFDGAARARELLDRLPEGMSGFVAAGLDALPHASGTD